MILYGDAWYQSKGPSWAVPTGRRDGTVSIRNESASQLPPPFPGISMLIDMFKAEGLILQDLVVLSGELGCRFDSSFWISFEAIPIKLMLLICWPVPHFPALILPTTQRGSSFLKMDPGSFTTFDTGYLVLAAVEARGAVPSLTRLFCRTHRREPMCYPMRVDLLPSSSTTSWTPRSSWGTFMSSRVRWNMLWC